MAKFLKPEPTGETDWKVPSPSSKYTENLSSVPNDGLWYVLADDLGGTTGEQTARSLNYPGSPYQFGYRVYVDKLNQRFVSAVAVRRVKK